MIKHILFDLDDTLYSARHGLGDYLNNRLREYVASWLGLSFEEAKLIQEDGYRRWGSSIRWLVCEKGFTQADEYFAYIHPEEEADSLSADPHLRKFLEDLPCPCSILTNSPAFHAERVLKKMELEGIFENTFDIISNNLIGKPDSSAFFRVLGVLGHGPDEVLFVDDVPHFVEGYLAIGGRGLLLDELDIHQNYPHERIKNIYEISPYLDKPYPGKPYTGEE